MVLAGEDAVSHTACVGDRDKDADALPGDVALVPSMNNRLDFCYCYKNLSKPRIRYRRSYSESNLLYLLASCACAKGDRAMGSKTKSSSVVIRTIVAAVYQLYVTLKRPHSCN